MNEYLEFKKKLEQLKTENIRPTLLLHSCCGPCSSYVLKLLEPYFQITIYYYNPNIYPKVEFDKRLATQQEIIDKLGYSIPIIVGEYDYSIYQKKITGCETMKEGSKRCFLCYEFRMKKCSELASELGFDYFTTTLSISPYKNGNWINEIGRNVQNKSNYLYSNFKKEEGYKKSIQLSKEYKIYRQDYCGCEYSIKEHEERIIQKK